jgi:hypothetical protein
MNGQDPRQRDPRLIDHSVHLAITLNGDTRRVAMEVGESVRFADLRAGDTLEFAIYGLTLDGIQVGVTPQGEPDATSEPDGDAAAAGAAAE